MDVVAQLLALAEPAAPAPAAPAPVRRPRRPRARPIVDGHRVCATCEENLPLSEFRLGKGAGGITSYRPDCRLCENAERRARHRFGSPENDSQ